MPDIPYFTAAELKAAYPNDDQVQELDDAAIDAARSTAEQIIEGLDAEEGAHIAFVPRTETFVFDGDGRRRLRIPRYRIRSVVEASIDGDAIDPDEITIGSSALVRAAWQIGDANVEVTITHGWPEPPGRIKDAAIVLAYNRLIKGPIDDRATGRLSPEGSVITLATPGLRGAITGIPEVDAAIKQYGKRKFAVYSVSTAGGRGGAAYRIYSKAPFA